MHYNLYVADIYAAIPAHVRKYIRAFHAASLARLTRIHIKRRKRRLD